MKAFLRKTLITLTALTTLFVVSGFILPEVAAGQSKEDNYAKNAANIAEWILFPGPNAFSSAASYIWSTSWWQSMLQDFFAGLAGLVLEFFGLLVGVAGNLLNGVIYYTVVNVSQNYNNLKPLSETWRVVRDIANIGFIFLLLYAAINTIIGRASDYQKIVVNVIVVALLINFSLFFTRVVIDASNILAITFYDASVPGALLGQQPESNALAGKAINTGLSNQFMRYLNLQNLWNVKESFDYRGIITIGLFGSILLLVTAFVFFAAAMMFIVRYAVLLLVLILSPLAMVSYILPQAEGVRKKWMDALVGQAFFAPIFLFFTWISLRILDGVMLAFGAATDTNGNPVIIKEKLTGLVIGENPLDLDAFQLILNFIIAIVLMVSALTISKDWANKAGNGMSSVTSWITGKAGMMTFGSMGWLGRNTFGKAAEKFKDSDAYRRMQIAAPNSRMARLGLAATNKTASGSFDIRGTRLGGMPGLSEAGGPAGLGGFEAERKKKVAEATAKSKAAASAANRNGITEAMAIAATTPVGTPLPAPVVAQMRGVRNLSNDDVVKLPATYIADQRLAEHIKPSQADAILDSDNFTRGEKDAFTEARNAPILTASLYSNVDAVRQGLMRLSAKEIKRIGMKMTRTSPGLEDATLIQAYTPSLLRRMATELDPNDIATLRPLILAGGDRDAIRWLRSSDGQATFS